MNTPSRSDRLAPTVFGVGVVLVLSAILIAFAVRPTHGLAVPKGSRVVHVDERDFRIQLHSSAPMLAGNYIFVDRNHGPSAHELVMWKTDNRADALPLAKDQRVNEDSKTLESVLDSGSSLQPGETRLLAVALDPGHYVLVCNLPGHYRSGMHVDITIQ